MSMIIKPRRSGGVIGTIGPIGGSGVFSLQERHALSVDDFDDVSLYLKMNGASGSTTFYDSSQYGHTVTANGNAQISTAQSKFGGASAAFDGSGDYLTVPNSTQFDLSGGVSFTVECWLYPVSLTGSPTIAFISKWTGGSGQPQSWLLYYESGEIRFLTSNFVFPAYAYSTLNQWVHVAVTSDGTNLRLFIDGILRDSVTGYTITEYNKDIEIGANVRLGVLQPFNGYIDDLRITKGLARYDGSYTPPQREFLP